MNNSEKLKSQVPEYLDIIKKESPLVHVITNHVSAGITARALTALGADPVMADYSIESAEITALSSALVINTGTPGGDSRAAYINALKTAEKHGIPAVLDPVGCASSRLRRDLNSELLQIFSFSVIKGNISEIAYITYGKRSGSVISAKKSTMEPGKTALDCANKFNSVCLVTGKRDTAASRENLCLIGGGTPTAALVSGTGCIAGAICGAFLAAGADPFTAAAGSSLVMRASAFEADKLAMGPGTFLPLFLDALYNISKKNIIRNGEIDEKSIM